MRPALERLRRIESHLLSPPSAAEAAHWHARQLLDPELATDTEIQRQLYQALHQAGRQQLRQELHLIHARLARATRRRGWLLAATDQLRRLLGR